MKRAILIRHGDTQRDPTTHEKVLSSRGMAQIESTARQLLAIYGPDLILYSPALRTTQSAQILWEMARSNGLTPILQPDNHLRTQGIPLTIATTEDSIETLFLVTHEPEIIFTLDQCCRSIDATHLRIDPANALVLEAPEWSEPSFVLREIIRPTRL